jgi:phage-related protein
MRPAIAARVAAGMRPADLLVIAKIRYYLRSGIGGAMAWTVSFLDERVEAEMEAQPAEIRARFVRLQQLIAEFGPSLLPPKYAKRIDDVLWELRNKGRDRIARAFYLTVSGKRVVIVRVFTKKTQKTPRREIALARQRAKEVR